MNTTSAREAADAGRIEPGTNAFGNYHWALRTAAELGDDYEVRYMKAEHRSGGCWSAESWAVVVNKSVARR